MDSRDCEIALVPLKEDDREQFILDNQEAFNYGALEEFGCRDEHFEEEDQIISRKTIEASIDNGSAYRIVKNGEKVGGLVVRLDGDYGELELLFVSPDAHSKGVGQAAWHAVESQYPQVRVWELFTPYFEKRNIHFYVNKLGFHIVEFFNSHHQSPNPQRDDNVDANFDGRRNGCPDEMFRFQKVVRQEQS